MQQACIPARDMEATVLQVVAANAKGVQNFQCRAALPRFGMPTQSEPSSKSYKTSACTIAPQIRRTKSASSCTALTC